MMHLIALVNAAIKIFSTLLWAWYYASVGWYDDAEEEYSLAPNGFVSDCLFCRLMSYTVEEIMRGEK